MADKDLISKQDLLNEIDAERGRLLGLGMKGAEHIIAHHARRLVEDAPAIDRWIPVTERLPEKHTNVLVYRPTMATKIMASYFGTDCFCDGALDIHGNKVITHWMPLPVPPKEVQDG